MDIAELLIREVELPLRSPFQTHQGTVQNRRLIIVEAKDREGRVGYGEVTAFETPFYTSETIKTAWHVMEEVIIPTLDWKLVTHPRDFHEACAFIQGHPMAKAGVEGALWDLYAKQHSQSLRELVGGERHRAKAGAVLSLSASLEDDIKRLKQDGYERFKLKVKKGEEWELIRKVQSIDSELDLMIDANGQYTEEDFDHLVSLDKAGLLMMEQPFRAGDFYLHRRLQELISTPVCLDESIMSFEDAVQAVQLNSCRMINVKISRVGGLTEALNIHDYCREHGIQVWCGGMVESGISKAHNLALASLEAFNIPGDLSSSTRYFERDFVTPGFVVSGGAIDVPEEPGIGVGIDTDYLQEVTLQTHAVKV
ncbi:o-succinylbenzoate synthase [Halobacillus litoralis]|uniref:o-succinylbenzoate synthase n=1 Tax=Halobacillus litoralis TaxID=45668 RepID=UPI001CD29DB7|nr:o-succinylbenzoate synthase [Halobacillus litoralis]MCA0972838.1 o-succinylbenzoate synthase [Halobacillus litoralis]